MLPDLSRQLRRLLEQATRPDAAYRRASSPAPDKNIIRLRAPAAARYGTSPAGRHGLLMAHGARMLATSVERGDGCSIAILDARGMVIAWHDTLPGATALDARVTGLHVSQFYVSHDVTFARPNRSLAAACIHGSDTQQRWHRPPLGSIFWAVTVIEALRLECGELNGYSHVTRYSQDSHGRALVSARRLPRQYSAFHGATAAA